MKFLSFLLAVVALSVRAQEEDHHESCACAATENDFEIDCNDETAMTAALTVVSNNGCANNCDNDLCRVNFWIMQAHHDYCLETELPEQVEDAFHVYEDACEECDILRKFDPSLDPCPNVDCESGGGNTAYLDMTAASCASDCSSATCQSNFKILKAFHDGCPEDSLGLTAELGYHDMEETCEDASCNIGTAADDAAQLVCDEEPEDDDDCGDGDGGCPAGTFLLPGIGCGCFSGISTVQTTSGSVLMRNVQLGDRVKTSQGTFEPVYGFAHYKPDATVEYLEITVESMQQEQQLQVSSNHMLQLKNGKYVQAGQLSTESVLYHGQSIRNIETVQSQGVFAPYTPSGTIQVDGVAASCYVVPDVTILGVRFSGHWLAHTFEFPHRAFCHYTNMGPDVCDSYQADGIHVMKQLPLDTVQLLMGNEQPLWVQQLFLAWLVAVLGVFSVVELVLFQYPALLVAGFVGGATFACRRRAASKKA